MTKTKTRAVIMLNGKRWDTPTFRQGYYWVMHPDGGEAGYPTMAYLRWAVTDWGGTIVREPNPFYRAPKPYNPLAEFFSI